jgi:hypothetical protein
MALARCVISVFIAVCSVRLSKDRERITFDFRSRIISNKALLFGDPYNTSDKQTVRPAAATDRLCSLVMPLPLLSDRSGGGAAAIMACVCA